MLNTLIEQHSDYRDVWTAFVSHIKAVIYIKHVKQEYYKWIAVMSKERQGTIPLYCGII